MNLVSAIALRRRGGFTRKVANLCRRYLDAFHNLNYDPESNGEGFVLSQLAGVEPDIIFDAGANVGDWTELATRHCQNARVFSFEISEPTFQQLKKRTSAWPKVECVNRGLSDHSGSVQIRHYDDLPVLTTATAYPHPLPYREVTAPVIRGDEFAQSHGIDSINLLKIDVEGMEEQVLLGFSDLFDRQAIDVVQFEYGRVSILTGFLLRHFYEFFEERGFVVGKIYPNYVDFRPYQLEDEDFIGPNFLACRRSLAGHLRRFSQSSD